MTRLLLAAVAALVSSAAVAEPFKINPFTPTRPTVSITGVAGVSGGSGQIGIRQTSDFNAAAGVLVAPRGSVNVSQQGAANGAIVGVFGANTSAVVSQSGRLGNLATIRQANPAFPSLPGRK
jgi:hypothetical protein